MGVMTLSSSTTQSSSGLSKRVPSRLGPLKRSSVLMSKTNKPKHSPLVVSPSQAVPLSLETSKENEKRLSNLVGLDYNEAAAKFEKLYKDKTEPPSQRKKKTRRLSLDKRIALKKKKEEGEMVASSCKKKLNEETEEEKRDKLVREYSSGTGLVGMGWKKMKIPAVLPSSEHAWLFNLMQPMKVILQVKEKLQKVLGREPSNDEIAEATNVDTAQLRKTWEIGQAARNKLIKHNLRLVVFVINKYFQEFANSPKFEDMCQAGVKGLITAIDRFEPKRRLQLSTYALFWIRHTIIRSMTLSSFIKVPYGLESVRSEIQKAKLELSFALNRMPTEEEIAERVGISLNRYHEVMKASKPVSSLHARDPITQEELINGIADTDAVEYADKRQQLALLRIALDDVIDSMNPKESIVIRQRYGLDGRGERTLGEIAGNLNISREMVRKHEMKALMKLKHPERLDYLRRYFLNHQIN
ncbi:unnamed protein product [Cuscuta epithymum]|uniref:RNA polymerase sigma factor sigE, chloroplastic/mitochondrial n=1 Tax=Cuscuta epithymum TaxID=186058 RepID=A0AAV0C358_9ASTE|nr:unnamed protein product [Cuscuta epithymum]